MRNALILMAALGFAGSAAAADIGLIKVANGSVEIQRGTVKVPAKVGTGAECHQSMSGRRPDTDRDLTGR